MAKMAEGRQRIWDGMHVSPRTTPSKGQSCALLIIGLAARAKLVMSPMMSCQSVCARVCVCVYVVTGPFDQHRYNDPVRTAIDTLLCRQVGCQKHRFLNGSSESGVLGNQQCCC